MVQQSPGSCSCHQTSFTVKHWEKLVKNDQLDPSIRYFSPPRNNQDALSHCTIKMMQVLTWTWSSLAIVIAAFITPAPAPLFFVISSLHSTYPCSTMVASQASREKVWFTLSDCKALLPPPASNTRLSQTSLTPPGYKIILTGCETCEVSRTPWFNLMQSSVRLTVQNRDLFGHSNHFPR